MVSGFMHNLIARHQDSSTELGAAQFVQPRHRARFETDVTHDQSAPSISISPNQRISSPPALNSIPPVSSSLHQQSVLTERDSVQLNPKPQVIASQNTGTEAPAQDLGHHIEEMRRCLRTPQQQTQIGEHAPKIQAEQPHIQIVEQRTEQQQRGIHTEDSDIRIEKIQHRLNVQQPKENQALAWNDEQSHSAQHKIHAGDSAGKRTGQPPQMRIIERQIEQQTSLGADTVSGRIEAILQRLTAKPKESPVMPFNQSAFSERITVTEQAQAPSPHPAAGLLELPGWLNGLQADLQSRWQEAAPQAQPEPVINVTIGRVEVRAMQQAKAESKPAARPQPSGVMSLDEYLKQREHRRG